MASSDVAAPQLRAPAPIRRADAEAVRSQGKRDADNTPFVILHTDYQTSGDQLSQELQALFEPVKQRRASHTMRRKELDYVLSTMLDSNNPQVFGLVSMIAATSGVSAARTASAATVPSFRAGTDFT